MSEERCPSISPDPDNYRCDRPDGHPGMHYHEVRWPGEIINRADVMWGD